MVLGRKIIKTLWRPNKEEFICFKDFFPLSLGIMWFGSLSFVCEGWSLGSGGW